MQVPGQEAVEHVDLVDLVDHVGGGPEHGDVEQDDGAGQQHLVAGEPEHGEGGGEER